MPMRNLRRLKKIDCVKSTDCAMNNVTRLQRFDDDPDSCNTRVPRRYITIYYDSKFRRVADYIQTYTVDSARITFITEIVMYLLFCCWKYQFRPCRIHLGVHFDLYSSLNILQFVKQKFSLSCYI